MGRTSSSERQRLLWRIHRRYATVTAPVRIGTQDLSFTRIADPDRVLDEVALEADRLERLTGRRQCDQSLHLPYWAELWESSVALAGFLADQGSQKGSGFRIQGSQGASESSVALKPRTVLDLGCGMGLAGTMAAALGARVLLADIETSALLFARLNSLPWSSRVLVRRIDWRRDRLAERFDLILGADILYERSQWEHLDAFWRGHLAPDGAVLLAEPGRQTGEMFLPWARSHGWQLQVHEQLTPTRPRPVRIICLDR